MLQRVRGWLHSKSPPLVTPDWDDIWIERQTSQGGWQRQFPNVAIKDPPEQPTADDDWWITDPGRHRAITRVDGHYGETLWEYETADAEQYYERQRKEEAQRQLLVEMSQDELEEEYYDGPERLDCLSIDEIGDRLRKLQQQE